MYQNTTEMPPLEDSPEHNLSALGKPCLQRTDHCKSTAVYLGDPEATHLLDVFEDQLLLGEADCKKYSLLLGHTSPSVKIFEPVINTL